MGDSGAGGEQYLAADHRRTVSRRSAWDLGPTSSRMRFSGAVLVIHLAARS